MGILRLASRIRPELREIVSSADGVTFWATDDKARREPGYSPRPLARGIAETYGRR
ncbi:MAG TPA: hypothetical protein VFM93_12340 [Candidatus Limnocylindria bacterium]|nr:hypothetical protein [Candidatus Limnocylindria bacterium]